MSSILNRAQHTYFELKVKTLFIYSSTKISCGMHNSTRRTGQLQHLPMCACVCVYLFWVHIHTEIDRAISFTCTHHALSCIRCFLFRLIFAFAFNMPATPTTTETTIIRSWTKWTYIIFDDYNLRLDLHNILIIQCIVWTLGTLFVRRPSYAVIIIIVIMMRM